MAKEKPQRVSISGMETKLSDQRRNDVSFIAPLRRMRGISVAPLLELYR